jgi:hypothetical protein
MSKSVNLYGHLVVDKIFVNSEFNESLGGIANVWNGLSKVEPDFNIQLLPTAIGEAIIVVDTKSNRRVGKAILNKKTLSVHPKTADWHHIAYINQITNLSFLDQLDGGLISADITKENPKNCIPFLSSIDFLFISKEDLFDDIISISKLTKGWVIAHDPYGSIFSDGENIQEFRIPTDQILTDINVLGAGDLFASCFISNYLKTKDLQSSIKNAHKNTTLLLKNL